MSEQRKKNEKNFLVQGSILAIAGVITKLIGAFYRIPLLNIIGTEGNGINILRKRILFRSVLNLFRGFDVDFLQPPFGSIKTGIRKSRRRRIQKCA